VAETKAQNTARYSAALTPEQEPSKSFFAIAEMLASNQSEV